MKFIKLHWKTILFFSIPIILIIPQSRRPVQVLLQKGVALFSPSILDKEDRKQLTEYQWTLMDEEGKRFDFKSVRGKVVVINFWATWCPPCIAEMPSFQKLYQDYKEETVFLLVSNEDSQVISKFKKENDYDFLVYASISSVPEIFKTTSIPKTYVIDKQGRIVVNESGAADWSSESVRRLLDDLLRAE